LGSDTYYFTGASFSSTTLAGNAWQTTSLAPTWGYLAPITWPVDMSHAFKLESRAEDNALQPDGTGNGNIGVPSTVGTDIVNFNIDFVLPSGTITYPSANAAISSATVVMTGPESDDLSGVKTTEVEISTGLGASKMDWNGS